MHGISMVHEVFYLLKTYLKTIFVQYSVQKIYFVNNKRDGTNNYKAELSRILKWFLVHEQPRNIRLNWVGIYSTCIKYGT